MERLRETLIAQALFEFRDVGVDLAEEFLVA
jgi:hypothetical protein